MFCWTQSVEESQVLYILVQEAVHFVTLILQNQTSIPNIGVLAQLRASKTSNEPYRGLFCEG